MQKTHADEFDVQLTPSLYAGGYNSVTNPDVIGCMAIRTISLAAPDKEVWAMNGNANVDSTKFIGTTSASDLIFKTNNTEQMRLVSNGELKLPNLSGSGERFLKVSPNGTLRIGINLGVPWETRGNTISSSDFFGTLNNEDLVLKTNSLERLRITANGKIGVNNTLPLFDMDITGTLRSTYLINTTANILQSDADGLISSTSISTLKNELNYWQSTSTSIGAGSDIKFMGGAVGIGEEPIVFTNLNKYKLLVNGSIGAKEVVIKATGPWPDYVFAKDYRLQNLIEIEQYLKQYRHLPNMPSAAEIEANGQSLSEIQRLQQQKIEELFLYVLQQQKEIEELKSLMNK